MTKTSETYQCPCGHIGPANADEFGPQCAAPFCANLLYPEDITARLAVGDTVKLHHAKSKDRKSGTVVKVGRTRCTIAVESIGWRGCVDTTRNINDPDIIVIARAAR